MSTTVNTFFWFDANVGEAADFYVAAIPNSAVTSSTPGPDGSPFVVTLELAGHSITLLNGGPGHPLNDSASVQVIVETQEEVDRLWDALTSGGGEPGPCGWLTDKYGLSWQVVPSALFTLMSGEPARSMAVNTTMRTMSKLDIKTLQDAYDNA
ncbi:VOC family protein [Nocardia sp. NPDC005978]|uniref:VOC family protein n=1 Tax=Nocardia sp. NPDC005978 TaxID=3156725 RepID=UPI0033A9F7CD